MAFYHLFTKVCNVEPKAILFYMGVLPGFFDLTALTVVDIALICILSFLIPLIGNLILAVFIGKARAILSSPTALRRTNTKVERRFAAVENALADQGKHPSEASLDEMDALWNQAKRTEHTA